MIDLFSDISAGCELTIPIAHHKGVGVIGAGGIVTGAHLPAYRKAGLPVRGCVVVVGRTEHVLPPHSATDR